MITSPGPCGPQQESALGARARWRETRWLALAVVLALATGGCTSRELAEERPALSKMEEPLPLFEEPDDEAERAALPPGSFSGIYVTDSRQSLEALLGEPDGILVERVVENSPGDLAGVRSGDLLVEATVGDGAPRALRWPSEWREIEIESAAGTVIELLLDRAASEQSTMLTLIERARSAERNDTERFREEDRVGVVLRTATEVEARSAGLGPGGGAVIVGLSKDSPWRAAGLRFEDLLVEIEDKPIAHPQVVLDEIRTAGARSRVSIDYVRDGERDSVRARVSRRAKEWKEFKIPLIASYERDRGEVQWSFLLGLFKYRGTEAEWRFRLFYLIKFGRGAADRLKEVDT